MATEIQRVAPPPGERLKFVQNTSTGCVHILPWDDPAGWREVTAAEALNGVAARARMLCPASLVIGFDRTWPAVRVSGNSFPDDDLCMACIRALGDQSSRAFHVDNRGDPDGD